MHILMTIITIAMSILASDINTENLVGDDLGTFFIKKLNLTEEETQESADELYQKGRELYYQSNQTKSTTLADGTTVNYSDSTYKKKSMKYLISAGLLGQPIAAVMAMKYLNFDGFIPGSKQYRYALAEQLNKQGYLYGTYVLGLGYALGNGIARDRDLALHYLGIIKDYCNSTPNEAHASLTIDYPEETDRTKLDKEGIRRCQLAILQYSNLKNTTFLTKTPITDKIESNKQMKEAIKQMLINKQQDAIEKYMENR